VSKRWYLAKVSMRNWNKFRFAELAGSIYERYSICKLICAKITMKTIRFWRFLYCCLLFLARCVGRISILVWKPTLRKTKKSASNIIFMASCYCFVSLPFLPTSTARTCCQNSNLLTCVCLIAYHPRFCWPVLLKA